jgi:hypothetical protein
MIKIIRQVCKKAGCEPKDLIVEWTPAKGARLVAICPDGTKTSLNVLARLDHIAQAIYLCANGQEHLYPKLRQQQAEVDAKLKELKACTAENNETAQQSFEEWQENLAQEEAATSAPRNWRNLKTPKAILRAFPKRPTTDDLIDLYQRNKSLNSSELNALLLNRSR